MIKNIKERGRSILNESYDKEGEWTFRGEVRASVIDYVIANEEVREEITSVTGAERNQTMFRWKL